MAVNTYPSLTTAGIIKNPIVIAENLVADYLGTNFSQSNMFVLKSLPKAVQEFGNSEVGIKSRVTSDLEELFGAYFNGVEVEVNTSTTNDEYGSATESRYNLIMEVWFEADGKRTSLVQALAVENSNISNIAELVIRK